MTPDGLNYVLKMPAATIAVNLALLAALVATGFYLIGRIRSRYRQSDPGSSHLLDNFRELHSQGELSDEEYRNIKSKLALRLRSELKEAEKTD